ncbi:DUF459 domain-containing protein [Campylobacter sp. MIT 21-1685]|uniref:SGNH/GDSL hydrolase family protein n=1 Tax=unclassified Campylobacter TaxID=2593542 RepID=UPI00224ABF6B|nr:MULTISPECIES: DUF459 domain-containing protein [unclassified Campylobacter]MCX2682384.1 DUF459 domain-containing protein [Campylobacter sp. MIT 21-1684]MCX2750664.1 DUF459 domain-containing protein [Campylobacter sp. MIT 21-1682]MCX2806788.1 DUF459 domain-containing protein [Campylobacter sp. MIT 21-1685]
MNVAKFFFIVTSSLILISLVMNQSISSYLEQKYHFIFYPQNDLFKEANILKIKLEQIRAIINNEFPITIQSNAQENEEENISNKLSLEYESTDFVEQNQSVSLVDSKNNTFQIQQSEEFLLIGDSLMQSVAIALNKDLRNLGIKTLNLSKQNTGLSYKSYFNWAQITEQTFKQNPHIKYLVVLLGANDPWDIKKAGVLYRFGSESWIDIYTSRVKELTELAKKYRVKIFWYEIPPVKKDDLNKKLQLLNNIYKKEMLDNDEFFITTYSSFSKNDKFSSYIQDENNKSVKIRSDDGIHFTPSGAKKMSKLLLIHLQIKENDE